MNSPNRLVYALFDLSPSSLNQQFIAAAEAYASKTMLRAASLPSWTTVAT